jgi:methionyl-tRNA formyltransferase
METYIVVGTKKWNRRIFDEKISHFKGNWVFIDSKNDLTLVKIKQYNPRYIFFLHWSWLVPEDVFENFECVCFHMADVPFGRGGSPLQNLIIRGHHKTKLTALRMVKELDAGPVYFKEDLSLEGNAEEIYIRATYLSAQMIRRIIEERPQPMPQEEEPVIFKRRNPIESQIPQCASMQALHDFIRMLDAEDYPHAYLEHGGFRYEFRRAALYDGRIIADVTISPMKEDKNE